MPREKQERKKLLLRIRPDLWEALSRMADAEFRSLNGQIEYLLEQAVRKKEKPGKQNES